MIDTEVESAMRSNSGKKKKKTFKRKKGEGKRGKKPKKKKKKNPTGSRTQLFFLKEEKFRVRSLGYAALGAPLSGAALREGEGRAPPLSGCERGSVTSLIPPSSGFLLLCCFFLSGRKAGSTFSFCKREQKAVLRARAAVSILSRSPPKLLQVPPIAYLFPEFLSSFGCLPQPGRARRSGIWDAESIQV